MFTAALSIFYWFILSKTENIKKNDGSFCLKDSFCLKESLVQLLKKWEKFDD